MMEQNFFPEERREKKGDKDRKQRREKKGRQAPEPQPEPRGTSKS